MMRKMRQSELDTVMQIWLEANISAHPFIPKEYWMSNYEAVRPMIADGVTVYEEGGELLGFMGVRDGYIAGIFVKADRRSEGIGEKLIDYAKEHNAALVLHVYLDNRQAVKFYLREEFTVIDKTVDEATGAAEYKMEWKKA